MPVIPTFGKWKLEDLEFKVTFSNMESSRPNWDTGDTFSNKQTKIKGTKKIEKNVKLRFNFTRTAYESTLPSNVSPDCLLRLGLLG